MNPLMVLMMANQEMNCLEPHLRESLVDPSKGSLMVPIMAHHMVPCTGLTHVAFLRPAQIWIMRRCSLHALDVAEAVIRTCGAAKKVTEDPTLGAVSKDCYNQSVSFVYSTNPTVAMGIQDCCRGSGE